MCVCVCVCVGEGEGRAVWGRVELNTYRCSQSEPIPYHSFIDTLLAIFFPPKSENVLSLMKIWLLKVNSVVEMLHTGTPIIIIGHFRESHHMQLVVST